MNGELYHASHLSAQKASAQKRTRLSEENGDRKRPQGLGSSQSKGQSQTFCLRRLFPIWSGKEFDTGLSGGSFVRPLCAFPVFETGPQTGKGAAA